MKFHEVILVIALTLLVEHGGAWAFILVRHWLRNPKRESFEEEDDRRE